MMRYAQDIGIVIWRNAIMQNVRYTLAGNQLTIVVDIDQRLGPSSTGKTTLVASTEGTAKIKGTEVRFSLTAYVPREQGS